MDVPRMHEATKQSESIPMSAKQRVGRGAVWTALSSGWTYVAGYVTTVLLIRSMSHVSYGTVALASSLITFGAIFTSFGLGQAVSTLAPRERRKIGEVGPAAVLQSALRLAAGLAALGVLGGVIASGVLAITGSGAVAVPFLLLIPVLVTAPFQVVLTGTLQVVFRPRFISASIIAQATVRMVLVVLLVLIFKHPSPPAAAITQTLGVMAAATVLSIGAWKLLQARTTVPGRTYTRQLLEFGAAMAFSAVAWTAVAQLDVTCLGFIKGRGAVGLYAPVSQLAFIVVSLPNLVGGYLLATLSGLVGSGDPTQVRRLYHWASRWGLVMAAGPLGVLLITPDHVLSAIYGPGFQPMVAPARILALGAIVSVMLGFNVLTLDAHRLARLTALRAGVGLVASVILCFALIPEIGAVGAAIATTGATIMINVLSSWALKTRCGIGPLDIDYALTIAAFGACLIVAWDFTRYVPIASDWTSMICVGAIVGVGPLAVSLMTEERFRRLARLIRFR